MWRKVSTSCDALSRPVSTGVVSTLASEVGHYFVFQLTDAGGGAD